jgi:hypothetical protein
MNDHEISKGNAVQQTYRAALVGGCVAGIMIIVIIAVALVIGLWLDKQFESANHIYLIGAIIISVPITFVAILWVAKYLSPRLRPPASEDLAAKDKQQEDA